MVKFVFELISWLLPKIGFVAILFAIGYKLAGGSGKTCVIVGVSGLLTFAAGYILSEIFSPTELFGTGE